MLGLIRDGRSNREIAEELGISLQGVKYHVTEILGKLGVEGRQQAARWKPDHARQWSFAVPSFLSIRAGAIASLAAPKVVLAGVTALTMMTLIGGLLLSAGGGDSENSGIAGLVAPEPTPTPAESPCAQVKVPCQVRHDVRTQVASVEEAATLSTFPPRLPTTVPDGFDEVTMIHVRPDFFTVYYPDGRTERNDDPFRADPFHDSLGTTYRSQAGSYLSVDQGYSIIPWAWYEMAPDSMKGSLELAGKELQWVRGSPKPTEEADLQNPGRADSGGWVEGALTLYWTMGSVELDAWEKLPGGEAQRSSRSFEYMISSDALPLDELIKIAESVLMTP